MSPDFHEIWEELCSENRQGEGWNTRRVCPASSCAIFAAVSGKEFQPALLVEVKASSIPAIPEYPRARGFEVTPVSVTAGRRGLVRLVLSLTSPQYTNVFEILAGDVSGVVANAPDEQAGVRALLARLRIWQEFMRRHGSEGLSTREQTGLFSELFFLRRHILPLLSASDSVRIWAGPNEETHDFVTSRTAIEVKGTTAVPASTFEVSSLLQLDETRVGNLCLCHYAWSIGPADGQTLPELIESIRETLANEDPTAMTLFNDSLVRVGYLDSQAPLYEDRRLKETHERIFEIQEGFPRLRTCDVPSGIAGGSYTVELAACADFHLEAAGLTRMLTGDIQ